jgi:hypothetical protein
MTLHSSITSVFRRWPYCGEGKSQGVKDFIRVSLIPYRDDVLKTIRICIKQFRVRSLDRVLYITGKLGYRNHGGPLRRGSIFFLSQEIIYSLLVKNIF